MKIPQATTQHGSFGIPEQIHPDNLKERRRVQAAADDEPLPPPPPPSESKDEGFAAPKDEPTKALGPVEQLAKLGVEFTAEDYMQNFQKGSIEKRIKVGYNPVDKRAIVATVRTLTPGEYDAMDECVMEEIDPLKASRDGVESRRMSWTLAFCLVAVDDRVIVKPIAKPDPETKFVEVDYKETAKLRKKAITRLNVHVVNKILKVYSVFDANVRLIMEDPESAFLEKP